MNLIGHNSKDGSLPGLAATSLHLGSLFGLIFLSACSGAPSTAAQGALDQPLPALIHSVEGPDLFQAYCATCHGFDAKGGGPMAVVLRTQPPDLTLLARRHDGHFPSESIRQTISGERLVSSHGSREMPVWGPIFHQVEADMDWGNVRLENLVKYLQSIQSAPATFPASAVSGATLYRQNCAVCHGNDLKGTGPAPDPYRAPPNLTTLARRHGGRFPDAYVEDVLHNGVKIPAHGLADMPAWGSDYRLASPSDPGQAKSRIAALIDYIKSQQAH